MCVYYTVTSIDLSLPQGSIGKYMFDKFKYFPLAHPFLTALVECSERDFSYCQRKLPTVDRFLGKKRYTTPHDDVTDKDGDSSAGNGGGGTPHDLNHSTSAHRDNRGLLIAAILSCFYLLTQFSL